MDFFKEEVGYFIKTIKFLSFLKSLGSYNDKMIEGDFRGIEKGKI